MMTELDLLPPLDDRPGPAKRISSQRAADLVSAALDRAAQPEPMAAPAPTPTPAPTARAVRGPGRRWRLLLVAAALVVAAGGASAAIYEYAIAPRLAEPQPEPARIAAPAPAPAVEAAVEAAVDDVEVILPEDEIEIAPAVEPEAEPEPAVDPEPRRRAGAERQAPDDLLAQANERRKDRRWRQADRLYQRVMQRHRGTTAAYVATVASASIHLDHLGDPRGALALYRAALRMRPRGSLAEEARWGIAESHRALGNRGDEAEALDQFVAAHPESPLRSRAERRLGQLP